MSIVSETYQFVVGVDTHAATHQFAILQAATGLVIAEAQFPTHSAGLARAAAWIGRCTEGDLGAVLISAEGTGSYGARLARVLSEIGYRVVDAPAPKRSPGQDKNDTVDAINAARSSLSKPANRLADVRSSDLQSILKTLTGARDLMARERTRTINALTALVRTHDLGIDARRKLTTTQIRTINCWRTRTEPLALAVARTEAIRLARRIQALETDLKDNEHQLRTLIATHAPTLLDLPGVGPVNAAVILTVWSHPGRIHHEAAFAKIGGVSPVEASSGNTHDHRLNRGGDRRLNSALHNIAMTRMRCNDETRAYVTRRTQQGLSRRRIQRCLKRYIAREIHRSLNAAPPLPVAA